MPRGANGPVGGWISLRPWRPVAESEWRGLVFALRAPSASTTQRSVTKRSRLAPYVASVRSVSLCGARQSSSSSHSSWETLRS
eukprot:14935122-Alexandrium_andersonii.AAC.1